MKVCIKCNNSKKIIDFYGVQGDCKECTKKRVREREEKLKQDPKWVEAEKKRSREKYHKLNYKGLYKQSAENKKDTTKKYIEKYPEKYNASCKSSKLKVKTKGNQLHHWSYNEEHYKDVIELSVKDHNTAHRFMIYDQERRMYRTLKGELLDTKEDHLLYITIQINKP